MCFTREPYMQELNKLRVIFQKNGSSNMFINQAIKKFEELQTKNTKKNFFIYNWLIIFSKNFLLIFHTA